MTTFKNKRTNLNLNEFQHLRDAEDGVVVDQDQPLEVFLLQKMSKNRLNFQARFCLVRFGT